MNTAVFLSTKQEMQHVSANQWWKISYSYIKTCLNKACQIMTVNTIGYAYTYKFANQRLKWPAISLSAHKQISKLSCMEIT